MTGEPAIRGPDGRLVLKPEMGLVFVLLPGGRVPVEDGHTPTPLNEVELICDALLTNGGVMRTNNVVGDAATLSSDAYYSAFMAYAERCDGYRSVWSWPGALDIP